MFSKGSSNIAQFSAPVKGRPRGLEARRPRGGLVIDLGGGRRIVLSAVRRPQYRRAAAGEVIELPRRLTGRIAAYAAMAPQDAEGLWAYALSLGGLTPG